MRSRSSDSRPATISPVAGSIASRRMHRSRLQDQFDALLYVCPLASMTYSRIPAVRCADPGYIQMRVQPATDGRPTDLEMLRTLRTRLATTGGKLLILSSPYAQTGALWSLQYRLFSRRSALVQTDRPPDRPPESNAIRVILCK